MSIDVRSAMSAAAVPAGAPVDPLLESDEIQGNVVPGFMKPFMAVLVLRIGDPGAASDWVLGLVPRVTTMDDVMPSRIAVREARLRERTVAGLTDVVASGTLDDRWLNVAFSFHALSALLALPPRDPAGPSFGADAGKFVDEAFAAGMAARSALLGDPSDPDAPGHVSNWVVGTDPDETDILVVFGADKQTSLDSFVEEIRLEAIAAGLTVVHEEHGGKLDEIGHEHFGFQDGVSQPGVRGRFASAPDTFVTPRTIDPSALPEAWLYGNPGQYLVWPGAFVFGYPVPGADPMLAGPPTLNGPLWSRNGSYVVYRRLHQDVPAFRTFLERESVSLRSQPGFEHMDADLLGALVVGRWPSGAPVSRTPTSDDPALGADPLANNHFEFATATPELPLLGGEPADRFPRASADPIGLTCPLSSHIRKVNTRDVGSDQGGRRSSFDRRILRRGLPYGPKLPPSGPDPADGNRGLMFLSYQASITDQFEFLNRVWMGDPAAPRAPSGHDLLVGQNAQPGEQRVRSCTFVTAAGEVGAVKTADEFVIPTGGGYFFSPSISALREVIGRDPSAGP